MNTESEADDEQVEGTSEAEASAENEQSKDTSEANTGKEDEQIDKASESKAETNEEQVDEPSDSKSEAEDEQADDPSELETDIEDKTDEGNSDTEVDVKGGQVHDAAVPVLYDFNHPQHRLGEPFAHLIFSGEKIAEEATDMLDSVLHVPGQVSLTSTDYCKRQELVNGLDKDTSIFKVRLEPVAVDALVFIDRELILTLVESFFGGSAEGDRPAASRGLSTTEQRLANRLRSCITSAMQVVWGGCFTVAQDNDHILRVEDLTTVIAEQSVVASLKYNVENNAKKSSFTIVLPWRAVESVRVKSSDDKPLNDIENRYWCTKLKDHIEECCVDLQGKMAESEVTVEQLLSMQSGDFIPLGDLRTATFIIENTPVFEAAIGTSDGQVSASILRWIDQGEL